MGKASRRKRDSKSIQDAIARRLTQRAARTREIMRIETEAQNEVLAERRARIGDDVLVYPPSTRT